MYISQNKIQYIIKIILIILFILVITFHLCILTGIIPYNLAWGGRLENKEQMYIFEIISILMVIFIFSMFFINLGSLTQNQKIKNFAKKSMWFFCIMFILNTIGNLYAKNYLEMIIATPLTFLSAILCIYLALKKD